jgi:hypothetical protein
MALELNLKILILVIASIAAWGFGIAASNFSQETLPSFFPDDSSVTLVALIVFTFSFLFFGYPSPLIMFLGGLMAGNHLKALGIDPYILVLTSASILASYSSIQLGIALLDDMVGKGNFKQALKFSLITTALFLIISVIFDLTR